MSNLELPVLSREVIHQLVQLLVSRGARTVLHYGHQLMSTRGAATLYPYHIWRDDDKRRYRNARAAKGQAGRHGKTNERGVDKRSAPRRFWLHTKLRW